MSNPSLLIIVLCLTAYFLGAIPFALIFSKYKGVDLRKIGSGNYGATNVYRAMGINYAILVFLCDALKGTIPTYLAVCFLQNSLWHVVIGFVAIIGHSLSCFINFKGGKGAATGIGVLLALSPIICSIIVFLAAILIKTTRFVAPTTIFCSILTPFLFYILNYPKSYVISLSVLCVFIIYRHKSNIKRILMGKENKV